MKASWVFYTFIVVLLPTPHLTCEIDFHTEAGSLMVLSGHNTSVLCDVTSCLSDPAPVDVTQDQGDPLIVRWRSPSGQVIGGPPNRVFSVGYHGGAMNQLILLEATHGVAGSYECSVERGGAVIRQRSIQVIVLNNIIQLHRTTTTTRRPRVQRRRRGDQILIEEEEVQLHFRPVRSVRPIDDLVRGLSIPLDKLNSQVLNNGRSSPTRLPIGTTMSKRTSSSSPEKTTLHFLFLNKGINVNDNLSLKDALDFSMSDRKETNLENDVIVNTQIPTFIEEVKNTLKHIDAKGSLKSENNNQSTKSIQTDSDVSSENIILDRSKRDTGGSDKNGTEYTTTSDEPKKDIRTISIVFVSEDSLDQTTVDPFVDTTTIDDATTTEGREKTTTTPESFETTTDETTTEPTTTSALDTTMDANKQTTESPTQTTTTDTDQGQQTGGTTPNPAGGSGGVTDSNTGDRPKWCETEESFFGRRGLAAFVVTLGVAMLLLFCLLMVIFLPNILRACQGKRTSINGGGNKSAIYRKRPSGVEAEAPMTLLSESTVEKDSRAEPEESTTSGEKVNQSYDEEDEINGNGGQVKSKAAVSTFLLRHNSMPGSSGNNRKGSNSESQTKDSEAVTTAEINIDVSENDAKQEYSATDTNGKLNKQQGSFVK